MKRFINKVSIFDFDGTLMSTPHPENGKDIWEQKTGYKYPHIGWWSKKESLNTKVFTIKPIISTVNDYKEEIKNPNTLVVMLTGRISLLSDQIEYVLMTHNLLFDEYHYKYINNTLISKLNVIEDLLNRYKDVKEIEMWEDREPHAVSFELWGVENDIPIKVNLVK